VEGDYNSCDLDEGCDYFLVTKDVNINWVGLHDVYVMLFSISLIKI